MEFYFYFDILQLYIYYLRYSRPPCGISVLHLQLYIYYLMYSRPPCGISLLHLQLHIYYLMYWRPQCGISLLHMHLYIWHYNIYKILFTVVWLSCFLAMVLSILLWFSVSGYPFGIFIIFFLFSSAFSLEIK